MYRDNLTVVRNAQQVNRVSPLSMGEIWAGVWRVLARKAPGPDGVPAELRASPEKQQQLANSIFHTLRAGKYAFRAGRVGSVPRPGKTPRKHLIPTLHDASVLGAVAHVLGEEVWPKLHPCLRGGRPGASCHGIIEDLEHLLAGREQFDLVRIDLQQAFATASFEASLEALRPLTSRPELLDLLRAFKEAQTDEVPGLIEGSAVAPLQLAALLHTYVIPALGAYADQTFVWLDDGAVIAPAGVGEEIRSRIAAALPDGMNIHPDKSFVVKATGGSNLEVDFLGFDLHGGSAVPSPGSREALVTAIRECVDEKDWDGIGDEASGWTAYFGLHPEAKAFAELDQRLSIEFGDKVPFLPRIRVIAAQGADVRADKAQIAHGRKEDHDEPRTYRWQKYVSGYPEDSSSHRRDQARGPNSRSSARRKASAGTGGAKAARAPSAAIQTRRSDAVEQLRRGVQLLVSAGNRFPELQRNEAALELARLIAALDRLADHLRPAPGLDGPLSEDDDGCDFVTFALRRNERELLDVALRNSMELSGSNSPSFNLSLMSIDFIATNDLIGADVDHRVRYLARIGKALGVELLAWERGKEHLLFVSPRLADELCFRAQ